MKKPLAKAEAILLFSKAFDLSIEEVVDKWREDLFSDEEADEFITYLRDHVHR